MAVDCCNYRELHPEYTHPGLQNQFGVTRV
jgi:hypothetical protein